MREILFRGKTYDGEWVYGSFCMDAREQFNGLCGVDGFIRLYDKAKGKMQTYEVDRETVGQYTVLKDKNGKRIFEGDIMKQKDITHKGEIQIEGEKYLVTSSSGCWFGICKKTDYKRSIFLSELCNIGEVIGNVHDNPELLEK